jgi:Fur family zinc uptake transcriptional regulator
MKPTLEKFPPKGRKLTSQRRAILEALQRAGKPMTAREALVRVRRSMPRTSLDTVYRNLLLLVQNGVVAQTHLQNRSASRFEFQADRRHHHHAVCLSCGRSFCLQGIPEPKFKAPREDPGFKVENHVMEFHGRCGACRSLSGRSAKE